MCIRISFMNSKNNKGLSNVPCGTPDSTLTELEVSPSTTTHCFWSHNHALIHFPILVDPLIPY